MVAILLNGFLTVGNTVGYCLNLSFNGYSNKIVYVKFNLNTFEEIERKKLGLFTFISFFEHLGQIYALGIHTINYLFSR